MEPCICGFDFWGTAIATAVGILFGGLLLGGAVALIQRYL